MHDARLSPDGHAVAFTSPAGGIEQVFLMLTSGGEPLQLTNDERDKFVDDFSPDGKEVYYGSIGRDEVWAVPTLGGSPRRVASAGYVLPSPDGTLFYVKFDNPAIFRMGKSGLNEELVYKPQDNSSLFPLLLFPGGKDLLLAGELGITQHALRKLAKRLGWSRPATTHGVFLYWCFRMMAERVGFEPTVGVNLHTLSKRAP